MANARPLRENLFRLVSVRPPQTPSDNALRGHFIRPPTRTPLHQALRDLDGAEDATRKAIDLSRTHLDSQGYAASLPQRDRPDRLTAVDASIRDALAGNAGDEGVLAAIDETLGEPVRQFLQREEVVGLERELWDALYAQALAPGERPADRDAILARLRTLHVLHAADGSGSAARLPAPVRELLSASPVLPPDLFPNPKEPAPMEPRPAVFPRPGAEPRREAQDRLRQLRGAAANLRQAARTRHLAEAREARPVAPRRDGRPPSLWRRVTGVGERRMLPAPDLAPLAIEPPWRLPAPAVERLGAATRRVLSDLDLSVDHHSVPELIEALEREMRANMASLPSGARHAAVRRVGSVYVATQPASQPSGPVPMVGTGGGVGPRVGLVDPLRRTRVRAMVGDLMVVRQELLRYEQGEVAHIENVLKSENKDREHRRLRTTEEAIAFETERFEESERDLQSTDRFEMQQEAQRTIESDLSLQAGLTTAASYGSVSITAYGDFAYQNSRSESERTAVRQARDVTERSLARLVERVREARTRRTLEEIEETNTHGLDNKNGAGHVVGVYRWVDKVYRGQVVNYGRRLMLEMVVPEPAAFYIHAETYRFDEGSLNMPLAPTVWDATGEEVPLDRPDQLDAVNYVAAVGRYNVAGIEAPPPEEVILGTAIELTPSTTPDQDVWYATPHKELEVPPGFRATEVWVRGDHESFQGYNLITIVGTELFVGGGPGLRRFINNIEKLVPVSVLDRALAVILNVEVRCERTPAEFERWQLKTFNAIRTAYEQQLAEYQERLAASAIRQGVVIAGRNPLRNREIEREELKKACITLMSGEDYASFDALRPGEPPRMNQPEVYPEIDVAEAAREGRRIGFFEQAFEWDQLTYVFYPYFWGRKDNWRAAHQIEDVDPLFTRFLQAGAARVLVPVRPTHESIVIDYLSVEPPREDPWNGGDAPVLGDPLYVSLVEELREATGGRPDGTPVGDPWDYRVPTSLVILQDDARLPDFAAG